MFGNRRHFIFQRVPKRHVPNVVKERGEAQDFRSLVTFGSATWEMVFQSPSNSCRELHHTQDMFKSCMLRSRVDQVRQTELLASVESLETRGMNNPHFFSGKLYISVDAVANDFH